MGTALRRCLLWSLAAAAVSMAPAHGLVIYRFGGEGLPPPPEAGSAGVEFVQLRWTDLDSTAGGEASELGIDDQAIRALERDPQVNIAPLTKASGGGPIRDYYNGQVFDGDTSTVWVALRYLCAEFDAKNYFIFCTDDFGTPGTANIDLGGRYQIDRIRVISGLRDPSKTVRAVRVYLAQKMPFTTITHHPRPWNPYLVQVRDNRSQVLDIPIPPHEEVGYVQVAIVEHNEDWEVHDIQIFAKGFVKKSTYVSNIVDFGQPMAWGELRWSGTKGERAKVVIQTRSGVDEDPVAYFRYTGRGEEKEEVSRAAYAGLKLGEKAGTGYDQEHWTFWSAYEFGDSSGTQVVSLSPRQYLQLKVDFLPQDEDGGEVRYLEFRASTPVASALVGEVWPVEAETGEQTAFTYVLRPTIGAGDAGFDRLEIQSLSLLGSVKGVRIGDVAVPLVVEEESPHRVVVSFPRLEAKDSGALVEVDFEAQVLRYGATFDARVSDSGQPLEVPQGVNGGDATGEYEGNRVSVSTSVKEQALLQVRVAPGVLTPNGDGVNEEARVEYEIFEITGSAAVRVEVLDLAGRRVRLLHQGAEGIGSYRRPWDGRDDDGQLLPPGIYPYSVSVAADREEVTKVGLLHVAY